MKKFDCSKQKQSLGMNLICWYKTLFAVMDSPRIGIPGTPANKYAPKFESRLDFLFIFFSNSHKLNIPLWGLYQIGEP
jgi:hypothetical protein